MQAVRVQTLMRKRTRQWKPVHHIKTDNMSGSSALLKACHQRKGQRLHCTKTTSREHSVTFSCGVKNVWAHQQKAETCINSTGGSVFYLQWGNEPRHTALLSIVTRNMWQFLKSDSILSMDSILKGKEIQYYNINRLFKEAAGLQTSGLVVWDKNTDAYEHPVIVKQFQYNDIKCVCTIDGIKEMVNTSVIQWYSFFSDVKYNTSYSLDVHFLPIYEISYFQAPNPARHRSEKMRTRLRTFIIASFTKLTWGSTTALDTRSIIH